MAITVLLANGKKLAVVDVSLVNSNTVTQNVTSTVTVPSLAMVEDIVGVARLDTNNSGVTVSLAGDNRIVVTAQGVPASSTTNLKVSVLGC